MRRVALMAGMILGLVGCGEAPTTDGLAASVPAPAEPVPGPTALQPGRLSLLGPTGEIKVGMTLEEAERVFPAPPQSFTLRELPPGFSDPFRARGYETYREGFGMILYGDRVALAMRREEDLTSTQVTNVILRYRELMGTPSADLREDPISYIFWFAEGQRLMIAQTPEPSKADRFDLTIALGDATAMDALRMNPIAAEQDRRQGKKVLEKWSAR